MAGIAELKARVEGALERISQQAEARDVFDQKLLTLIDIMERGLTRKQAQIDEQQASLAALEAEQAEVSAAQDKLRQENAALVARSEALEAEVGELKSGAAARESEAAEATELLEKLLTALDQQGESRLLEALEELGRRAADFSDGNEGEAEVPEANPPALQSPAQTAEAEMPETPCSPEMAAVIEGYDKRAEEADGGEAVEMLEPAPEVIAEIEESDEEALEIPAEAELPTDEIPRIAEEAGAETAESTDLSPPIVTGIEPVDEELAAETEASDPAGGSGELSLEAIGELLKERDEARRPATGGRSESVKTIIDRVNALADEMADPSSEAGALTAQAEPSVQEAEIVETEAADDEVTDEAAPKTATGG